MLYSRILVLFLGYRGPLACFCLFYHVMWCDECKNAHIMDYGIHMRRSQWRLLQWCSVVIQLMAPATWTMKGRCLDRGWCDPLDCLADVLVPAGTRNRRATVRANWPIFTPPWKPCDTAGDDNAIWRATLQRNRLVTFSSDNNLFPVWIIAS